MIREGNPYKVIRVKIFNSSFIVFYLVLVSYPSYAGKGRKVLQHRSAQRAAGLSLDTRPHVLEDLEIQTSQNIVLRLAGVIKNLQEVEIESLFLKSERIVDRVFSAHFSILRRQAGEMKSLQRHAVINLDLMRRCLSRIVERKREIGAHEVELRKIRARGEGRIHSKRVSDHETNIQELKMSIGLDIAELHELYFSAAETEAFCLAVLEAFLKVVELEEYLHRFYGIAGAEAEDFDKRESMIEALRTMLLESTRARAAAGLESLRAYEEW